MPAMLSPVQTRGVWAATVVGAALLLGVGFAVSTAEAQSDAAAAPWQAHPYEGHDLPPPDSPSRCESGQRCAPCNNACDEADDGDCGRPCSVTDWCRWPDIFYPCGRLSFRGEYLGWWTKGAKLPSLATTSPAATPRSQAGVLGESGTEILFGGGDVDLGVSSGARFSLAYWFSPCRDVGLDVTYLFLGNKAATFDDTSDGGVIIARPFLNVTTGLQDSVIIAYPGQQKGFLNIRSDNELDSLELVFRKALFQECNRQLDFLLGYRFARFDETLSIEESSTFISQVGDIRQGTIIAASDRFGVRNEFNGAEIGIAAKSRCCRWSLELLTKLAMGNTRSLVNINGATTVTVPGQSPVNSNGGVLALPTNSTPNGDYQRNDFSVIPEFGINVGYDLTCRLKATFGWTFLYWSHVMRPGDQIDTELNPTQFPPGTLSGLAAPQFRPATSDFWAQGINVGLDYRY
jgi:hypothetical protein